MPNSFPNRELQKENNNNEYPILIQTECNKKQKTP